MNSETGYTNQLIAENESLRADLTHLREQVEKVTQERDDWRLSFEASNDHVGKLEATVTALRLTQERYENAQCVICAQHLDQPETGLHIALARERQTVTALRETLETLWIWASEQRTHLDTDPVPDGLGAHVLNVFQGREQAQEEPCSCRGMADDCPRCNGIEGREKG